MVKARRAEKLSGGPTDKSEAEALQMVARSVRGKPERVDDAVVKTVRRNLDEFFLRLQDPTLPPENPIKRLREIIGCSQIQLAATTSYSLSRWASIEAGGISVLPSPFLKIVADLFGASAAAVFEKSWNRYRASLSAEARRAVEMKLCPLGSGAMIP